MATVTKTAPMKFEITLDAKERRTLDAIDARPNAVLNASVVELEVVIRQWLRSRLDTRRTEWAQKNFVE